MDPQTTVVASESVETYFQNKQIDHSKYFTRDQEHYNYPHSINSRKIFKTLDKPKYIVYYNIGVLR